MSCILINGILSFVFPMFYHVLSKYCVIESDSTSINTVDVFIAFA
jgi:hypothetical protein